MAWVKVDDGFADHRKFVDLSLADLGLWAAGLAYANRQRTDGRIPTGWVRRMSGTRQAKALVAAGLWHECEDGWEIHDYLDYQRSAEEIDELSAKRAASGRQGGTKKAANAKQLANQVAKQTASKSLPEEEEEKENNPPTPLRILEVASSEPAAPSSQRTRGTRIPDDFEVTEEMRRWARSELPGLDWSFETDKFLDHWRSKSSNATKLRWDLAWRNWLRIAYERSGGKKVAR